MAQRAPQREGLILGFAFDKAPVVHMMSLQDGQYFSEDLLKAIQLSQLIQGNLSGLGDSPEIDSRFSRMSFSFLANRQSDSIIISTN